MPIVHEVDCRTGIAAQREMTEEEISATTALQAEGAADAARGEGARLQRTADLALLRAQGVAHADPTVQAAARLLVGAISEHVSGQA